MSRPLTAGSRERRMGWHWEVWQDAIMMWHQWSAWHGPRTGDYLSMEAHSWHSRHNQPRYQHKTGMTKSHTTITETTDIIPSVRKWESPPWPVSAISVCYDSEPVPMFRPSPAPRPVPASDTERVTVSRYWRVERDRECYMLHVTQWVLARIKVNVSWLQFHFITSRVQLTFLSPPPTMAHWVKIVLNNCDRSETSWHLQLFGKFYQCRPSGHNVFEGRSKLRYSLFIF